MYSFSSTRVIDASRTRSKTPSLDIFDLFIGASIMKQLASFWDVDERSSLMEIALFNHYPLFECFLRCGFPASDRMLSQIVIKRDVTTFNRLLIENHYCPLEIRMRIITWAIGIGWLDVISDSIIVEYFQKVSIHTREAITKIFTESPFVDVHVSTILAALEIAWLSRNLNLINFLYKNHLSEYENFYISHAASINSLDLAQAICMLYPKVSSVSMILSIRQYVGCANKVIKYLFRRLSCDSKTEFLEVLNFCVGRRRWDLHLLLIRCWPHGWAHSSFVSSQMAIEDAELITHELFEIINELSIEDCIVIYRALNGYLMLEIAIFRVCERFFIESSPNMRYILQFIDAGIEDVLKFSNSISYRDLMVKRYGGPIGYALIKEANNNLQFDRAKQKIDDFGISYAKVFRTAALRLDFEVLRSMQSSYSKDLIDSLDGLPFEIRDFIDYDLVQLKYFEARSLLKNKNDFDMLIEILKRIKYLGIASRRLFLLIADLHDNSQILDLIASRFPLTDAVQLVRAVS